MAGAELDSYPSFPFWYNWVTEADDEDILFKEPVRQIGRYFGIPQPDWSNRRHIMAKDFESCFLHSASELSSVFLELSD